VIYQVGAELLVIVHCAFVAFVVFGALLVLYRPWIAFLHVPMALWGATTELLGIVCPLTPLEQALWRRAGEAGYEGGFIEHYLLPLVYPAGLTRSVQIALGIAVLLVNLALYAWIVIRDRRPY
jgi:Protein of Unknown function (DUF2784)